VGREGKERLRLGEGGGGGTWKESLRQRAGEREALGQTENQRVQADDNDSEVYLTEERLGRRD
jgi:hypothetical protein